MLDPLSDKRLQNSGLLDKSGSTCFLDLDIEGMDRQIRKKLQLKRLVKGRNSSKRLSIKLPVLDNEDNPGEKKDLENNKIKKP